MDTKQYLIELKKVTTESNAFVARVMRDHQRGLISDAEYADVLTEERRQYQNQLIDLAGRLALHEITG
jgi:hypothetical protein